LQYLFSLVLSFACLFLCLLLCSLSSWDRILWKGGTETVIKVLSYSLNHSSSINFFALVTSLYLFYSPSFVFYLLPLCPFSIFLLKTETWSHLVVLVLCENLFLLLLFFLFLIIIFGSEKLKCMKYEKSTRRKSKIWDMSYEFKRR